MKSDALSSRVTSGGRITIPALLPKELGIKAGTRVNWRVEDKRLVLTPITASGIKRLEGWLKPKPGDPSMFEECLAERERERKKEKF